MKTQTLILVILAMALISSGQNVNIPDENFKNKLIEIGVDTNNDGEISFEEAEAINHTLDVSNGEIIDLTGIEAFVNIKKLHINNNNLTSFNLDALQTLDVLNCSNNLLTILDVSNYESLSVLNCSNNSIESFIVDENYQGLTQINCNFNQLDTIILENYPALYSIKCNNNILNYFRLENCNDNYELHQIDISNNNLDNVEFINCPKIKLLKITGASISYLTFNKVQRLETINLESTQITNIDLSSVLEIDELDISNNTVLETLCVGILPEPFNLIDNNTSTYNKLTCNPVPGDLFYAGQLSNTFNHHYDFPAFSNDSIDINGDNIKDFYQWWETETWPSGNFLSQCYIKGLNGTNILSDENSIINLNAFSSVIDHNYEWNDEQFYIGYVELLGWDIQWNFYVGDGRYNAIRSIIGNDTTHSWVKFGYDETYYIKIESFASWKPCNNILDLGENILMTTSDSIVLSAGQNYDSYFWSTGETTESITLYGENLGIGIYDITCLVSYGSCNYEDTINVTVIEAQGIFGANNLQVNVYPNPAENYIEVNVGELRNCVFKLYGLNGETLMDRQLLKGENSLNINHLSEGCYFIQVYNGKRSFFMKLIKIQ